jgi:hypothetical protein
VLLLDIPRDEAKLERTLAPVEHVHVLFRLIPVDE